MFLVINFSFTSDIILYKPTFFLQIIVCKKGSKYSPMSNI